MLLNFSLRQEPPSEELDLKGTRSTARPDGSKLASQFRGYRRNGTGAQTRKSSYPSKHQESRNEYQQEEEQSASKHPRKVQKLQHLTRHPEITSSLFTSNPQGGTIVGAHSDPIIPKVHPSNAPLPDHVSNFTALGLYPSLATHLTSSLHLTSPTAIQQAAIPPLLQKDVDVFMQAETGSGKTLAYLLPILQRMLHLKTTSLDAKMNRKSGLFMLILAPTRELVRQINETLTLLLKKMPWLVHGTVSGGATKSHEKARIRKGINVLVATPGRLIDHIENTQTLNLECIRWLVLDEGDRLMELGFEHDVLKIIDALGKSRIPVEDSKSVSKTADFAPQGTVKAEHRTSALPARMTTVLCSATMKADVQRLGKISLRDAQLIRPVVPASTATMAGAQGPSARNESHHSVDPGVLNISGHQNPIRAPSQLRQSYVVVPPKQRLVTLKALLQRIFSRERALRKALIFMSCADNVDFHFEVFGRDEQDGGADSDPSKCDLARSQSKERVHRSNAQDDQECKLITTTTSPMLSKAGSPSVRLFRIHGSLPQRVRSATIAEFSRSSRASVLFCTDLASRGLDLPEVDLVVEYDPPFSSDDHLHRVGRTARAGKEGTAVCFLMPGPEEGYVSILKAVAGEGMIKGETAEDVLRAGLSQIREHVGRTHIRWDQIATDWQLGVERWVLRNEGAARLARKAYTSHVRAYATHVAGERHMFDVKQLHLGHLAKAFALRETPRRMQLLGTCKPIKTAGYSHNSISRSHTGEEVRGAEGQSIGIFDSIQSDTSRAVVSSTPKRHGDNAAEKMRLRAKEHMAAAGEFNIGT